MNWNTHQNWNLHIARSARHACSRYARTYLPAALVTILIIEVQRCDKEMYSEDVKDKWDSWISIAEKM